MSTRIYCDRCGDCLTGDLPVKSLAVSRWRGGTPAVGDRVDLCDNCGHRLHLWLRSETVCPECDGGGGTERDPSGAFTLECPVCSGSGAIKATS